jgi:hypothetical protein
MLHLIEEHLQRLIDGQELLLRRYPNTDWLLGTNMAAQPIGGGAAVCRVIIVGKTEATLARGPGWLYTLRRADLVKPDELAALKARAKAEAVAKYKELAAEFDKTDPEVGF